MSSNELLLNPIFPVMEFVTGLIGLFIVYIFRKALMPLIAPGFFRNFINLAIILTALAFMFLVIISIVQAVIIFYNMKLNDI